MSEQAFPNHHGVHPHAEPAGRKGNPAPDTERPAGRPRSHGSVRSSGAELATPSLGALNLSVLRRSTSCSRLAEWPADNVCATRNVPAEILTGCTARRFARLLGVFVHTTSLFDVIISTQHKRANESLPPSREKNRQTTKVVLKSNGISVLKLASQIRPKFSCVCDHKSTTGAAQSADTHQQREMLLPPFPLSP